MPGPELDGERAHELRVSEVVRALPLLALPVADAAQRDRIERCIIALLSNANAAVSVDPPSATWLGRWSPSTRVKSSGLWNQNYVLQPYSPAALAELEKIVGALGSDAGL